MFRNRFLSYKKGFFLLLVLFSWLGKPLYASALPDTVSYPSRVQADIREPIGPDISEVSMACFDGRMFQDWDALYSFFENCGLNSALDGPLSVESVGGGKFYILPFRPIPRDVSSDTRCRRWRVNISIPGLTTSQPGGFPECFEGAMEQQSCPSSPFFLGARKDLRLSLPGLYLSESRNTLGWHLCPTNDSNIIDRRTVEARRGRRFCVFAWAKYQGDETGRTSLGPRLRWRFVAVYASKKVPLAILLQGLVEADESSSSSKIDYFHDTLDDLGCWPGELPKRPWRFPAKALVDRTRQEGSEAGLEPEVSGIFFRYPSDQIMTVSFYKSEAQGDDLTMRTRVDFFYSESQSQRTDGRSESQSQRTDGRGYKRKRFISTAREPKQSRVTLCPDVRSEYCSPPSEGKLGKKNEDFEATFLYWMNMRPIKSKRLLSYPSYNGPLAKVAFLAQNTKILVHKT